jgi:hypothetical protein
MGLEETENGCSGGKAQISSKARWPCPSRSNNSSNKIINSSSLSNSNNSSCAVSYSYSHYSLDSNSINSNSKPADAAATSAPEMHRVEFFVLWSIILRTLQFTCLSA